jgi:hypothetical protein
LLGTALFVAAAALSGWAWIDSGQWAYLLTALGFAAIVPSSVRRPVKRVDGEATATPPSPRWATTLALAGGALIIVGFALRWLGS